VDVTEGEVDEERLVLVGGGEVDGGVHQPLGQLRRYFEFYLCLSRACLGEMSLFSDKTAQKSVFRTWLRSRRFVGCSTIMDSVLPACRIRGRGREGPKLAPAPTIGIPSNVTLLADVGALWLLWL
jgi:hypothetical protein